jgi:type II protein arginine methyltransferase
LTISPIVGPELTDDAPPGDPGDPGGRPLAPAPLAPAPLALAPTAQAPTATDMRVAAAARLAGEAEVGRLQSMLRSTSDPAGRPDLDAVGALAARTVPRWHFAMLNDGERNDALAVALERLVRPGAHVLDIGSGTGLLALMAARAGAGHVTTCETDPLLAELARQIVAANGMSEVISVVAKPSTELVPGQDLPRRADLIVAEVIDCGLIGEGILPTLRHAREHLLAGGGALLPRTARLLGCLVTSRALAQLNGVQTVSGFDLRLFNRVATPGHFPIRLTTWPHRLLSEPTELLRFDFARDELADGHRRFELRPNAGGRAHGLVAWFELDVGGGVVLRNSPDNLGSHWMQAYVPFPHPVETTAGVPVRMDLAWQGGRITAQLPITAHVERNHR